MTELSLTTRQIINAPTDTVFNAWLDPQLLPKFIIPGPGVRTIAQVDPKVGGRFSLMMMQGDNKMPHAGTYLEIVPHSRLVFTWEASHSADGTTVTLTFAPTDAGETLVELTQVKFVSQESADNHTKGWTSILTHLQKIFA